MVRKLICAFIVFNVCALKDNNIRSYFHDVKIKSKSGFKINIEHLFTDDELEIICTNILATGILKNHFIKISLKELKGKKIGNIFAAEAFFNILKIDEKILIKSELIKLYVNTEKHNESTIFLTQNYTIFYENYELKSKNDTKISFSKITGKEYIISNGNKEVAKIGSAELDFERNGIFEGIEIFNSDFSANIEKIETTKDFVILKNLNANFKFENNVCLLKVQEIRLDEKFQPTFDSAILIEIKNLIILSENAEMKDKILVLKDVKIFYNNKKIGVAEKLSINLETKEFKFINGKNLI